MRILLLIGSSDFGKIVFNNLNNKYNIVGIVKESSKNKKRLLINRMKKLGLFKTIGQMLFILYSRYLKKRSESRIKEILINNNLTKKEIIDNNIITVDNINDNEVERFLITVEFDLVIVTGTGIIKENILNLINKPIINIHVGITPKYRGVHGGYWALVNNDAENCGVTIHHVDKGVDTGGVLSQDIIEITSYDNFTTYPYLQFAKSLKLLDEIIQNVHSGKEFKYLTNELESKQWYHPTIVEYIYNRIVKGIK